MSEFTPIQVSTAADDIRVGFVSDAGRMRARNEDSFTLYLAYRGEEKRTPVDAFFAVADGMGGHDRGDLASRYIASAVNRALTTPSDGFPQRSAEIGAWIDALVRRINRGLIELSEDLGNGRPMGSTLTLALLWQRTLFVGHVGDTRCYRLRDGVLRQLTNDDSWVAEQTRAGLLTPEEAASHPNRNWLTQCLGMDADPGVSLLEEPVADRDRYLLCSDGLHGLVPDATLALVLSRSASPQEAARRLVELSNGAGGSDNITAVVFDVNPVADESAAVVGTGRPLDATLPGVTGGPPAPRRRWRLVMTSALLAGAALTGMGAWLLGVGRSADLEPSPPSLDTPPAARAAPAAEVPLGDAPVPGAPPSAGPGQEVAPRDSALPGAPEDAVFPPDPAYEDTSARGRNAPSSLQEE
jgi:PPM family protein phosphatase